MQVVEAFMTFNNYLMLNFMICSPW